MPGRSADVERSQATTWSLLFLAIAIEVGSSLALKGALDIPALYVVVVLGFVTGFVLLTTLLRRGMPIGILYGIWSATGVALTAVMSAVVFGEPFNLTMMVGIGLVITGVVTIELGSHVAQIDGNTS